MSDLLVSIIIPSFNSADYIERLMESIINQTYTNWEAIIVDNNSVDDTVNLIKKKSDPRFKIFTINNNGIIAKSRNFGIKKSKGEWIAFLDSDDWWDSRKLEVASKYFNSDIDLIYHKLSLAFDNNLISSKTLFSRDTRNSAFKELLIHGNFIPNSSVVLRKSVLNSVGLISEKTNIIGSEDYNFLLRIAKHSNKFKFINKKLGFYYMNLNGVSRKQMSLCHEEAISEFLFYCNENELNFIKGHLAYMDARFLLKKRDLKNSKLFLWEAFKSGTLKIKLKSIVSFFQVLIYD